MPLPTLPPEWRTFKDQRTGATVTQWTSHPAIHHHCYFTNPTVTHDAGRGVFISYRSGYPNLFTIDLASGELAQVTSRVDINPFSPAPSRTSPWIYFSARQSVWAVHADTGEERELFRLSEKGGLGNCSLNHAGTLLAIGARYPDRCELVIVDTDTGKASIATRGPEIGHIQFSPRDDSRLIYSGTGRQRIWLHDRKAGKDTWLYQQLESEWIVHESWRMGERDEVIFPHWPHALRAIRSDGTGLRTIASINAWHACSSPDGSMIVCDTNHPDRGLLLIDAESGCHRALCHPQATQRGTQWRLTEPAKGAGIDTSIIRSATPENDPPPKPNDPAGVYGPQWTHPHPTFTPDGKTVIHTSDRDGWSQVYAVGIVM